MSSRKTKSGSSAISSMVRKGTNQAIAAVKKRYTGKQAPRNIANDFKNVMSLLNTEDKQVYTLATAQAVTQAASLIYGIGTMAQGTTSATRIGDSIKVNRVQLLMQFNYSTGAVATTSQQNQIFNWYLIRYLKTPSSSGTTAFGISEFLNTDGFGVYTPLSFPNSDTNQNFQIMASGQAKVQLAFNSTAPSTESQLVEIDHTCSFHQDYSGAAATTITENMCFVVVTAMNPANAGSGLSSVSIQAAMWFIDN